MIESKGEVVQGEDPGSAPPLLPPDTRAMVAGVTLSTVAIATFLLMPQFVEAAVADLRYTEQQVGILSSVVMVGSTLAALAASLWIRRSSWRLVASITLIGLLLANGASMLLHGPAWFIALQGVGGFCGGSLYSLSLTILSDCRRSDRYFAYAVGAQTMYQVFGLIAGPFLIHHGGVNAMLTLFVALCVLGLLCVRCVPVHGRIRIAVPLGAGLLSRPVLLALAGCFLFYINIGAYWTYIERIGTTAGIGLTAISNGLAFSTVASMAGVFLASWLGGRRGFLLPIAWSAIAVLLAMVLLLGKLQLAAYVVSAVVYGIAWNVSMTYQYSTVNLVDRSRRGVALAPAFHNAGGAAGPAIAALVVTANDHSGVLWLVSVSVVASLVCFVIALRLHARAPPYGCSSRSRPPSAAAMLAMNAPINMDSAVKIDASAAAFRAASAAARALFAASMAAARKSSTRRCASAGGTPVCAATSSAK